MYIGYWTLKQLLLLLLYAVIMNISFAEISGIRVPLKIKMTSPRGCRPKVIKRDYFQARPPFTMCCRQASNEERSSTA